MSNKPVYFVWHAFDFHQSLLTRRMHIHRSKLYYHFHLFTLVSDSTKPGVKVVKRNFFRLVCRLFLFLDLKDIANMY